MAAGVWLAHMQISQGSPIFPLYNAVFRSPYFPQVSGDDPRFGADGLKDFLITPFWLLSAPGLNFFDSGFETSELPSSDARWLVSCVLGLGFLGWYLLLRKRGVASSTSGTGLISELRGLWLYSVGVYAIWLSAFGIQRYAIPLEMLITVLSVSTLYLLLREVAASLAMRGGDALATVGAFGLVAGLILTTGPVTGWGRIPASWNEPAVALASSADLSQFSTILVPTPPIAYAALAAGRNGRGPSWIGYSFTPADAERGRAKVAEPLAVLVRAEDQEPAETAEAIAASYGVGNAAGWDCRLTYTGLGESNWLCTRGPAS